MPRLMPKPLPAGPRARLGTKKSARGKRQRHALLNWWGEVLKGTLRPNGTRSRCCCQSGSAAPHAVRNSFEMFGHCSNECIDCIYGCAQRQCPSASSLNDGSEPITILELCEPSLHAREVCAEELCRRKHCARGSCLGHRFPEMNDNSVTCRCAVCQKPQVFAVHVMTHVCELHFFPNNRQARAAASHSSRLTFLLFHIVCVTVGVDGANGSQLDF